MNNGGFILGWGGCGGGVMIQGEGRTIEAEDNRKAEEGNRERVELTQHYWDVYQEEDEVDLVEEALVGWGCGGHSGGLWVGDVGLDLDLDGWGWGMGERECCLVPWG